VRRAAASLSHGLPVQVTHKDSDSWTGLRIGITNYENEHELSWHKVKTHLETPLGHVVYEGESELPKKEIEEPHEHYVAKNDTEDYWDKILAYLHLMRLPSDVDEAR
jgi:hypothetical protein